MNIDSFKAGGEKVLGFRRNEECNWIQEQTWKEIGKGREIKQKTNSTPSEQIRERLSREYTELDREMRKMTKLDRKEFVERLGDQAEEADGRHNASGL